MALTPLKLSAMTSVTLPWAGTERVPVVKNPGGGDANFRGTILQLHTLVPKTVSTLGSASTAGAGAMRWVTDLAGGANIAVSNGTNWIFVSAPIYDLGLYIPGVPSGGGSSILQKIMVPRNITFPADFAGAFGHVTTAPDDPWIVDVQDDGVSIGTITVDTGGTFTFATAGGTAKSIIAGSRLEFVEPVTPDASIANVSLSLTALLTAGLIAAAA